MASTADYEDQSVQGVMVACDKLPHKSVLDMIVGSCCPAGRRQRSRNAGTRMIGHWAWAEALRRSRQPDQQPKVALSTPSEGRLDVLERAHEVLEYGAG
jgi:hypothetical protein